jgi:transcriptional regulator GlxA family with amidase domain
MISNSPTALPRRIHILAIDRVFATTAMQPKDLFHLAELRHGRLPDAHPESLLDTCLVSPGGRAATTFSGVVLPVDGDLGDAEVIILPAFGGDFDSLKARYPRVIPWLRAQHARGALLCAEASGVYWLAEAGLLDGKEATTYWRFFEDFAQRYPQVLLNPDKHLTDADSLYCAAGSTSSCDLYVYLIERFCGVAVAQAVSREILFEVQRTYSPGRLGFGGQKLHHDPVILSIQQWLEAHFAEKFRFEDVARDHGMSIRNFMRRFHTATGDKPLHYLQRLRIETAKGLLSATRKSIKTISYEVGYDDASFFARLFRHHTQLSPNQYRQQFMQEA